MTTTEGCEDNVEAETVVVIDLENDSLSNVVNMKMPKRPARKRRGSNSKGLKNDKKFPTKGYIYIDDDDDDDVESAGKHIPRKSFCPMNLSKSKRMYPGRGPTGCGLNVQSDDNGDDDGKSVIHKKEGESIDNVEGTIVNEREKIKDSVEYKQAQEEELSARELALKLQAEEAQKQRRLLKRKKAEKLRLLAVKRRQKQRVEEIRESQKQDEENMNKREIYRIEIQQDLRKLEMTCRDMASLLYRLGILTDGPYASPDQVHAAYKRALLRFHPDRACTGSDMRKQVEAEEKFKLISRMKERVSNTPRLK